MPRKKFKCKTDIPYHIVGRTHNKVPFELPLDYVWSISSEDLYFMSHSFKIKILNFVLMNNHFHLVAMAPLANLSNGMQFFMQSSSRHINKKTKSINQLWGNRFHRTELNTYYYLLNTYKYVYQNPVRAKLCEKVEDYPYSTLQGILGQKHHLIPTSLEVQLFDYGIDATLEWLNKRPTDEAVESVRRALKKSVFQLPKQGGHKNSWEEKLI